MSNPRKKKPASFSEIITPRNLIIGGAGLLAYGLAIYLFGRIAPQNLNHYDLIELLFSAICAMTVIIISYFRLK